MKGKLGPTVQTLLSVIGAHYVSLPIVVETDMWGTAQQDDASQKAARADACLLENFILGLKFQYTGNTMNKQAARR